MNFSNTRTSVSVGFFLFGLSLASFALFLHPMDPADFLVKAVLSPQETFSVMYGYVQSLAFWFSAACMAIGISGMVMLALHRWYRKQPISKSDPSETDGEGEENWMFL